MQSVVITGITTTGGVATEVTITNAPPISRIANVDLIVASHSHISAIVKSTAAAADKTAFVELLDGTGAALGQVSFVAGAGGAASNSNVPTDKAKAARKALTVVTTVPDADGKIQLTAVDKFKLYLTIGMTVDDVLILQAMVVGEVTRP
jgi:hypothetical protein